MAGECLSVCVSTTCVLRGDRVMKSITWTMSLATRLNQNGNGWCVCVSHSLSFSVQRLCKREPTTLVEARELLQGYICADRAI